MTYKWFIFLTWNIIFWFCFRSDQISRSVESQHTRPPCPSPTLGVHSNSHPLSQWCHPSISSSVIPLSSCPQSLPASESFPVSQLFAWGGQSTGASALSLFLPKKSQGWSPSEWTGWISLQSKGLSRVFSNTTALLKLSCLWQIGISSHRLLFLFDKTLADFDSLKLSDVFFFEISWLSSPPLYLYAFIPVSMFSCSV